MRLFGKAMQLVGLIVPVASILAQLTQAITAGQMLLFLAASCCAFYLGRLLEGYA